MASIGTISVRAAIGCSRDGTAARAEKKQKKKFRNRHNGPT
jgi:hypothetical protein